MAANTTDEHTSTRRAVAELCITMAKQVRLARAYAASALTDKERSEIASAAMHADAAAAMIFDNP